MAYDIDPIRGVARHYNTREVDETHGGIEQQDGRVKTLEYMFGVDGLPTFADDGGFTKSIPADAVITDVYVDVDEDFTTAGGTGTVDIGLAQKDGTAIDADGLVAAAAEADLVAGYHAEGAGELVNANIGANAGQVVVTPSEALTGGKGRLLVRYVLGR